MTHFGYPGVYHNYRAEIFNKIFDKARNQIKRPLRSNEMHLLKFEFAYSNASAFLLTEAMLWREV